MLCPYCQTENRDDRETCYQCGKDLSMLRLIVNKAKHHYNSALEHAERGRVEEAIAELKNALDLDSSMVNAHVVLGTLYVKQEMFDEARASWRRALQADHRFEKAHDYLAKSATAEYVFPIVKRLRATCMALGTAVALLLLASASVLMYRHTRIGMDDLATSIGGGRISSAEAHEVLQRFAANEKADAAARRFARDLNEHMETELQEKLNLAGQALANNDPVLALQVADSLASQNPDERTKNSVRRVRSMAYQQVIERARDRVAAFDRGHEEYDIAIARLREGLKVLKPGEEQAELQALADRVTSKHHERLMAEAKTRFEGASLAEATQAYLDWKSRYPELEEKLNPLMDARLDALTTETGIRVGAAVERDEFGAARGAIEELHAAYSAAGRPQPEALQKAWSARIETTERERLLKAADLAYADRRWEDFLTRTTDTARLTTDTAKQTELSERRSRAETNLATARWEWMQQRAARFERGTITPEDAGRVLAQYEQVLAHLPDKQAANRGAVLFYAAVSSFKLERLDEARRLLGDVKRDFAEAPVQKAVKSFEKKFAKQLNPAPVETPEAGGEKADAEKTDSEKTDAGKTADETAEEKPAAEKEKARPALPDEE